MEYADFSTEPQPVAHTERPASSSTDALSAGVPTMGKRTAHLKNATTIAGNDKEDFSYVGDIDLWTSQTSDFIPITYQAIKLVLII